MGSKSSCYDREGKKKSIRKKRNVLVLKFIQQIKIKNLSLFVGQKKLKKDYSP
jgi:hypothetical protein